MHFENERMRYALDRQRPDPAQHIEDDIVRMNEILKGMEEVLKHNEKEMSYFKPELYDDIAANRDSWADCIALMGRLAEDIRDAEGKP